MVEHFWNKALWHEQQVERRKEVNCSAAWRKCCVVGFQPRLQVSHCKATWTTKIIDFRRHWGSNRFLVSRVIRGYVMVEDKAGYSLPSCLEISGVHFLSVQVMYLCNQLGLSHPPVHWYTPCYTLPCTMYLGTAWYTANWPVLRL